MPLDNPFGAGWPLRDRHPLSAFVTGLGLAYRDPGRSLAPRPFRLAWASGLPGVDLALPADAPDPADPTPAHAADVLVVDAAGRVVFDSTQASAFHAVPTGAGSQTLVWSGPAGVLRLACGTGTPGPALRPRAAYLDPRTCSRLPDRLEQVLVRTESGLVAVGPRVPLAGGYSAGVTLEGGVVTVAADPTAPAAPCDPDEHPPVRRLGGVGPDAAGNVDLLAGACHTVHRTITEVAPPPGTLTYTGVVDGVLYARPGEALPLGVADGSGLFLQNHCRPCCRCDDFAAAGVALLRTAVDAGAAANAQTASWARVAAVSAALSARTVPAAVGLAARLPGGRAYVGAAFVSAAGCCLENVELRLTLSPGTDPPPEVEGVRAHDPTPTVETAGDDWPVVRLAYPRVGPYGRATAGVRLSARQGVVTLTAHADPAACDAPAGAAAPGWLAARWADAGVADRPVLGLWTANLESL